MRDLSFQHLDQEVLSLFWLTDSEKDLVVRVRRSRPHHAFLGAGAWREDPSTGAVLWEYADGTQLCTKLERFKPVEARKVLRRADSCFRLCRSQLSQEAWGKAVQSLSDPVVAEVTDAGEGLSGGKMFHRRMMLLGGYKSFLQAVSDLEWTGSCLWSAGEITSEKGLQALFTLRYLHGSLYEVALESPQKPETIRRLRHRDFKLIESYLHSKSLASLARDQNLSHASLKEAMKRIRRILGLKKNEQLVAAWEEWRLYEMCP